MLDRKVWHPVHTSSLTSAQRSSVIRSSMFLKEKFHADGRPDRYKARLVAGGDQQNKELYGELSSPTVSTTNVLTVAAIAAQEGRSVITLDIPGAFFNASMAPTGVLVFVRLDKLLTGMLVKLAPDYAEYVEVAGTVVVQLDMALYGCVEAAGLWYDVLIGVLQNYGFTANAFDACVLNRVGSNGKQTTVTIHVDDLLVTSAVAEDLAALAKHLDGLYKGATLHSGKIINYVGMTLDFSAPGEVSITMSRAIDSILSSSGMDGESSTPAFPFLLTDVAIISLRM